MTYNRFKQKRWILAIMKYIKNYNWKKTTTDNIPKELLNGVLNVLATVL